jgi:hypothetical protein
MSPRGIFNKTHLLSSSNVAPRYFHFSKTHLSLERWIPFHLSPPSSLHNIIFAEHSEVPVTSVSLPPFVSHRGHFKFAWAAPGGVGFFK